MEYRQLGRSGLRVSALSIGGWLTFGATADAESTAQILDAAVAGGVNFIDLADVYARGAAESCVGRWLRGRDRTELVLSSKCFWPMGPGPNQRGLSRKHILESVEASLGRLGTDYLDIYFAHRFDPETPLRETLAAMDHLVQRGRVLYWGTSVWSAEQLEEAWELCERHGYQPPIVEQPRYNLLDRHVEADIAPTARRLGMGLVVWSPLAGGVLTGKYNDGAPSDSRGARSSWLDDVLTEANLQRVARLAELAADQGLSAAQLSLAWLIAQPGVTCAITGATRRTQVEENLAAVAQPLPAATLDAVDALFAE
ncbi:MAG: aldo/keto reductase family protein [Deltaproteobacteria bacterium]|nr:aldo/keto reductase family protein [Deltaproteobacteria bacterium]MCB9788680.1 aldo/keto reductase family protein [Deltaproteobacteria bacterium]